MSSRHGLDVVGGDYPRAVAKATDQPLGVDLLLHHQNVALVEAEFVVVFTDVGVQCLHTSAEGETERGGWHRNSEGEGKC